MDADDLINWNYTETYLVLGLTCESRFENILIVREREPQDDGMIINFSKLYLI